MYPWSCTLLWLSSQGSEQSILDMIPHAYSFRPAPKITLQVANLAIMARLESDVDYIAASLAVQMN